MVQLHSKSPSPPCPEGTFLPPGCSGEPGSFFKPSPRQRRSRHGPSATGEDAEHPRSSPGLKQRGAAPSPSRLSYLK